MARQVVLFGGTFDPVHFGHLIVARSIAEACGFERITLVPAAAPPHKSAASASPTDRLAMLRLATEGEGLFDICEDELSREGTSYTFDTLTALRARHGEAAELHWIVGADMLEDLPNWYRADDVIALARIVVACRAPWHERVGAIVSGLADRFGTAGGERLGQAIVETPLIDISSTAIRQRVNQGLSVRYLVPEPVRAYIRSQGLYRAQKKI